MGYQRTEKRREYERKYYKHRYATDPQYRLRANAKSKAHYLAALAIKRQWVDNLKSTLSCSLCPESDPRCLDFHHRDPTTKLFTISDAASFLRVSLDKIKEEVAKCDVLCANCHRKLHYNRTIG